MFGGRVVVVKMLQSVWKTVLGQAGILSSRLYTDSESITRRADPHNRTGMLAQGLLLVMNAEALYEPPSNAHCQIYCSWESEMTSLALIPKNKIMFLITMDNLPVIPSSIVDCRQRQGAIYLGRADGGARMRVFIAEERKPRTENA